jgi:hypothetical protein
MANIKSIKNIAIKRRNERQAYANSRPILHINLIGGGGVGNGCLSFHIPIVVHALSKSNKEPLTHTFAWAR